MDECQIYLWGAGDGLGGSLLHPTAINPDARPLGTYETKMATRTGTRLILAILRKKKRTVNSLKIE